MELGHPAMVPTRGARSPRSLGIRDARAAAVAVLSFVALTSTISLAAEAPSSMAGAWTLATSANCERQRLEAIDDATEHLRSLQRDRARERLEERTAPPERLTIEFEGSSVTIASGRSEVQLELGGSPVELPDEQGEASATMEGGELIVAASSRKGTRTTRYRPSGDRLSVEVTITAEVLAGPLTVSTTYLRAE